MTLPIELRSMNFLSFSEVRVVEFLIDNRLVFRQNGAVTSAMNLPCLPIVWRSKLGSAAQAPYFRAMTSPGVWSL